MEDRVAIAVGDVERIEIRSLDPSKTLMLTSAISLLLLYFGYVIQPET